METTERHFYRRLNRYRRWVQVLSLLLFAAIPVLNGYGIHTLIGTLYSLSIGDLDIADPVMVLQTVLLSRQIYVPLLLAVWVPVVIAWLFGRVFCSWVCPQNTLSEWIDAVQQRLFARRWKQVHHFKYGKNPHAAWYWLIFGLLILLTAVLGVPLLAYLSAPGIITSSLSQAILQHHVGVEILLVLGVLVVEAAIFRRFWCKYGCPVGAGLALFQGRRSLRVHFNSDLCDCKPGTAPCYAECPLHLAPKETATLYPYCFNCGLCVTFCEKAGRALTFGFSAADPMGNAPRDIDSKPFQLIQVSRHK